MRALYPIENGQKRGLARRRYLGPMLLWGFWVLAALQSPAPSSAHLALGLAAVAAALLVVLAAAGLPAPAMPVPGAFRGVAQRARVRGVPRLIDPDAAGRPRSRAPSAYPAAV
jgi:uncharacterized protein DUF6412